MCRDKNRNNSIYKIYDKNKLFSLDNENVNTDTISDYDVNQIYMENIVDIICFYNIYSVDELIDFINDKDNHDDLYSNNYLLWNIPEDIRYRNKDYLNLVEDRGNWLEKFIDMHNRDLYDCYMESFNDFHLPFCLEEAKYIMSYLEYDDDYEMTL